MPAMGVRPPFLILAAVLAIAPVAGIPPRQADAILPTPCATSSMLGRCLEPIILSATTAESRDSTPARNAIVTAFENWPFTASKLNIERSMLMGGSPALMSSNDLPIVLTSRWKISTIAAVTITATNDPGIFLKIMGQTISMASAIAPIITACQLRVVTLLNSAMSFSDVSIGFSPFR